VLDSLWGRLLDAVAHKLPPAVIDQWVRPCRLLAIEGDHLRVGAPNSFSRDWLVQHHFQALQQASHAVISHLLVHDDRDPRLANEHGLRCLLQRLKLMLNKPIPR